MILSRGGRKTGRWKVYIAGLALGGNGLFSCPYNTYGQNYIASGTTTFSK